MAKIQKEKSRKSLPEKNITPVAENILAAMTEIAANAREALQAPAADLMNVLAFGNTLTNTRALPTLSAIADEQRNALFQAINEPTIARIVVRAKDGTTKTFFFLRATPQSRSAAGATLASLRSPVGRLASLPVGEFFELASSGGIQTVEVLERTTLRPEHLSGGWDAFNSVFETDGFGPVTIKSLRTLVGLTGQVDEEVDPLEELLASDRAAQVVSAGIRRSILKRMTLRDQPLLDQYQDEIFRLPIDARLAILGPPGSGKTTTLIKRLGLKLDWEHLEDAEKSLITRSFASQGFHSQSWVMFTPTELLKLYVKEAFAREGVAASNLLIHTWSDYRHEIARRDFRILRTSNNRSGLVFDNESQSLTDRAIDHQTEWADDFAKWQRDIYWEELRVDASVLRENDSAALVTLGTRLQAIIDKEIQDGDRFIGITALDNELRDTSTRLGTEIERTIRGTLSRFLRADRDLLDKLLTFIPTLEDTGDDIDETDNEEEDENQQQLLGREVAFDAYKQAIRAQARAALSRRSVGPQTRAGRLLAWLGDRVLAPGEAIAVGKSLRVQTSIRAFSNAIRRYILDVGRRYRRYRRDQDGNWYRSGALQSSTVGPLEVDLLLLTMLRTARTLLSVPQIMRDIDQPRYAALKVVAQLLRNQVLVDEATDFAPLQLGCMDALSDPAIGAFVACGDFHQRITPWGVRTSEELSWAAPRISTREINITYRHTRELNELARSIVLLSDSAARTVQLPADVDNDGVAPVLGLNLADNNAIAAWLCARIAEIERQTRDFPSVAVLVSHEDDVIPLASALDHALGSINLRAVPCLNGQAVGQENDVRVFDVQHIKGLEFEAVFFVDLDRLADKAPDLFDKYLYVGTTRAATYLGLSVRASKLPDRVSSLRALFADSWT